MKLSQYIIGNDSGLMHIARTTGVKNITLYTQEYWYDITFGPLNNGKIIYKNDVGDITVDLVYSMFCEDYLI